MYPIAWGRSIRFFVNIFTPASVPTPSLTFLECSLVGSLAVREDGLDEDADAALGRVPAADDGEAQRLPPAPLLEHDGVEPQLQGLGAPPQRGRGRGAAAAVLRGSAKASIRTLELREVIESQLSIWKQLTCLPPTDEATEIPVTHDTPDTCVGERSIRN